MGDPSYLRFVPAECAATPIDWNKVPEASKKVLEQWSYNYEKEVHRPLPTTIGELAKRFDESKFFGYMGTELCTLLLDISEFGLAAPAAGEQSGTTAKYVGPRFYMKYLEEVWFVLFFPGKRDGVTGYSAKVEPKFVAGDDSDEEEEDPSDEIAMAQAFDAKLDREASRVGAILLLSVSKTLGGWTAFTLQKSLEQSQLSEALMSLPMGHPAQSAYLKNMFR